MISQALIAIGLALIGGHHQEPATTVLVVEPVEVVEPVAIEPIALTPGPSVTATADCSRIDFAASGYADGTTIFIGVGSQPPYGYTIGSSVTWGFSPSPGGVSGSVSTGLYEQTHGYGLRIDTDDGTGNVRVIDRRIDCSSG